MPTISIVANGNSESLALEQATLHVLKLRATAFDPLFEAAVEYADIGDTNWRPLPVRPYEDPEKLTPDYQDMVVLAPTQIRLVVSNYGSSNTVTLESVPMESVTTDDIVAALDAKKVLVEDQAYIWTNNETGGVDNVTVTRPDV